MKVIIISLALFGVCLALPTSLRQEEQLTDEEIEAIQDANAHYSYSSQINDNISDLTNQRMEVRDGANVKGVYSYSDGYFRHTVEYIADKDGYRIINQTAERLDGPKINLNGKASVESSAHGHKIKYVVQSVPDQEEKH